jgi:SAM-dependent methyltransferase
MSLFIGAGGVKSFQKFFKWPVCNFIFKHGELMMGELFNLTNASAKLYDGPPRNMDPTFGFDYFDNTRDTGYGGYNYDGRWRPVAQAIIKKYNLKAGDRFLDLGCGKGFLLNDLMEECPGLEVRGLEVSQYAIDKAHNGTSAHMDFGSVEKLPYPDNHFDVVMGINVFHFPTPENAEIGVKEMMRVGKEDARFFIQVDAFTNDIERERLLAWAPIIKTVYSVNDWFDLFKRANYKDDYFWTFVRPENPEKFK